LGDLFRAAVAEAAAAQCAAGASADGRGGRAAAAATAVRWRQRRGWGFGRPLGMCFGFCRRAGLRCSKPILRPCLEAFWGLFFGGVALFGRRVMVRIWGALFGGTRLMRRRYRSDDGEWNRSPWSAGCVWSVPAAGSKFKVRFTAPASHHVNCVWILFVIGWGLAGLFDLCYVFCSGFFFFFFLSWRGITELTHCCAGHWPE
jgi:hypothetical protein